MSEELWIKGKRLLLSSGKTVNNWMKFKYSRYFRKISFMLETQVTSKTRCDWEKESTDGGQARGREAGLCGQIVSTAMDWAHGKLSEAGSSRCSAAGLEQTRDPDIVR